MKQTQITIEIFEELFDKDQRKALTDQPFKDVDEVDEPNFPKDFPKEIDNPVIFDGYGEEDIRDADTKETEILLGSYTPMQSPGIISFYKTNIKKYAGSLIRKVVNSGISLGLDTALFTIYFVVDDIMKHESFHYYCDYKRQLTGAKYQRNKEEAFAVAHSYQNMHNWHTFFQAFRHEHGFIHGSEYHDFFREYFYDSPKEKLCRNRMEAIFNFLLTEHYKGYSLPGYKDWPLYKERDSYKTHFYEYLKNDQLDKLLSNGVPVNDIHDEIDHLKNRGAKIQLI